MRWKINLKRIAGECKNRTYNFPNERDCKSIIKYYLDMYDQYEEDMTDKQANEVMNWINILTHAVIEKYPNIKID